MGSEMCIRDRFVTVTSVETSPDLRHAVVHVSVLGSEEEREQTLAALTSAHTVLQSTINSQLRLKRTPALTFAYDDSIERAARLTEMIDELPIEDTDDDAEDTDPPGTPL